MHTFTTIQLVVAALCYAFVLLFALNAWLEVIKLDRKCRRYSEIRAEDTKEIARLQRLVIEQAAEINGAF